MFFAASKIVWFLIQPSSLIALILLAGIGLGFRSGWERAGRVLAITGFGLLLIGGLSPLANALLLPLENRVQRARLNAGDEIAGIIFLGGFENGRISAARRALTVNENAERLMEAMILAWQFPRAKLIFSGGAAALFREEVSGAAGIAAFLRRSGIEDSRVILEARSRNTYENAVFSKAAAEPHGPLARTRWLLVTSAFHMPRALGCFRQAGFDVLAWPVDYRTKGIGDLARPFASIGAGLRRLDLGAKEWLGLAVYWWTGKTAAFLPG